MLPNTLVLSYFNLEVYFILAGVTEHLSRNCYGTGLGWTLCLLFRVSLCFTLSLPSNSWGGGILRVIFLFFILFLQLIQP